MATKIQWTNETWNCISGCTRHSRGCRRCYAETMTKRLKAMGQMKYSAGFDEVVVHQDCLSIPTKWKDPRMIFVNSMSDTFHRDVPTSFIRQIFEVMGELPQHTFQVLTKRSERLVELTDELPWHENIWMGVTVEHEDYVSRIDDLRKIPAKVRFLSVEPMLGSLPNLNLDGIHQVIVGGESGPGSKPLPEEWIIDIRDQCVSQGVAFFFKQYGGTKSKKLGRLLQGQMWDEMPKVA